MTASTPRNEPSGSRTTGIPPPPLATTTNPASTRARTAQGGVEGRQHDIGHVGTVARGDSAVGEIALTGDAAEVKEKRSAPGRRSAVARIAG